MSELDEILETLATSAAQSAARVFAENGWEYAEGLGKNRRTFVPDEARLRQTVRYLLDNASVGPAPSNRATGRFHVSRENESGVDCYYVSLELGDAEAPPSREQGNSQ